MVKKKIRQEGGNKILFYFVLILFVISLAVFFVNIDKFFKITGKATGTGTANLTIESITNINFTTNNINWGSGAVTAGYSNATLNTAGGANNVTNGNWTGNTAGLVIENIGNKNVTLLIKAGANAAGLLGGTGPQYMFNFTSSEANSCTFNATTTAGTFYDANITDRYVCDSFNTEQNNDTLRIDLKLVIPSNSRTGAVGDIITATATAI